jgi:hypothetical protein
LGRCTVAFIALLGICRQPASAQQFDRHFGVTKCGLSLRYSHNKEQALEALVQKIAASLLSGVLLTATAPEVEAAGRYAVGWCQVASGDLQDSLSPTGIAADYIYEYQRDNPKFKSIDSSDFRRGAKVTLLSQPKLGKIEQTDNNWLYQPTTFNEDRTRAGRDHFVMKVENKGITIFVHYYIEVIGDDPTTYIGEDGERYAHDYCKRESWKISSSTFE